MAPSICCSRAKEEQWRNPGAKGDPELLHHRRRGRGVVVNVKESQCLRKTFGVVQG